MTGGKVSWCVELPAIPTAALRIKIPYAIEQHQGFAACSSIDVSGRHSSVEIRESAIVAYLGEALQGTVMIELRTAASNVPGLAIRVIG
jgi:hypothetical protein